MGLFSKKTLVCTECGREYEARLAIGAKLCPDCQKRKKELQDQIQGYLDYRVSANLFDELTEAAMKQIVAHREAILEKNRLENPISKKELVSLGKNHAGLSDAECKDILGRAIKEMIQDATPGCGYTDGMLFPAEFDNVVVSAEDVFAVAYTTSYKAKELWNITGEGQDAILCAIFTNDPYVPVLPYLTVGSMGFFSMHSKEGRARVAETFMQKCPNLAYPVCELKELKKTLKAEGRVRGNLELKYMQDCIFDAECESGIFNPKNYIKKDANPVTMKLLEEMGYVKLVDISKALGLENKVFDTFWKKKLETLF